MRFTAFSALAVPLSVAATIVSRDDSDQCSSGDILCCDATTMVTEQSLPTLEAIFGLSLPHILGLAGLTCTPLSVLTTAGQSCTKQAVCCLNNSFGGLIALGCVAVNV